MGRGRGKGRKSNDNVNHSDWGITEEEKIPVQKKRGRPLKHLKESVRDGVSKMGEGDKDNVSFIIASKHKSQCDESLKKRKMKYESKEKGEYSETVKEESADETTKSSSIEEEPVKSSGFRRKSRRKNTPRRAAEAVVECF